MLYFSHYTYLFCKIKIKTYALASLLCRRKFLFQVPFLCSRIEHFSLIVSEIHLLQSLRLSLSLYTSIQEKICRCNQRPKYWTYFIIVETENYTGKYILLINYIEHMVRLQRLTKEFGCITVHVEKLFSSSASFLMMSHYTNPFCKK